MENLFKVILIQILLQGISAELMNMAPENWNDVIFDSQNGDEYCFYLVRPLINQLKRVNKQIDANDEMKETIVKLEKELASVKMELKEQEVQVEAKIYLLNEKDEQIRDLKVVTSTKDGQIENLLKTQDAILTEVKNLKDWINSKNEELKTNNDLLKSKDEQIREQLKVQSTVLSENNKRIKDLSDSINSKDKPFGNQLTSNNDLLKSKDEQINQLNNTINDKNKQIDELRTQITKDSKILEEKNQQMMKYNQQEENLLNSGLYADNVHHIQIAGHPPFEVPYISPLSGWTVIQRRMDGSVDFRRDWKDYKNGFGDIRGEFFLGLEKIYLMTQSRPHELYIQMQDVDGTNKYARYDNFKVGNEEDNYKLISTGEYNGIAGDSLGDHVGYMFTTRDRDNDIDDGNCAIIGGGWWYLNCGYSQLNGIFNVDGTDESKNGIAWGSWKDWNYEISLTYTQMMIRPTLQLN